MCETFLACYHQLISDVNSNDIFIRRRGCDHDQKDLRSSTLELSKCAIMYKKEIAPHRLNPSFFAFGHCIEN